MKRQLQPWALEAQTQLTREYKGFRFDLHYHKNDEATGKCPHCAAQQGDAGGTDRFIVYIEGNWYCRRCEKRGWWSQTRETPEETQARRLVEDQRRMTLKAQIATCPDWQLYHQQVSQGLELWKAFGIDEQDIAKWGLGFCTQAPCADYATASLTIPVFHKQQLVDIRHRLVNPQTGQKYRSHMPGLPPAFLNLDAINDSGVVYLVEGEKKTVVLEHHGLHPVISYPGMHSISALRHILAQEGAKSQRFVFLPDPDSERSLTPIWRELRKEFKVGVVDLIRKPDDFVMEFGFDALNNALVYPRWL